MLGYIGKRAIQSAISLILLVSAVFFLARLTGDPAKLLLPIDADQETIQAFREREGLDRPVLEQFITFVGDALRGDLGNSLRLNRPALDLVLEAYPATLQLAFVTMVLALAGACVVGALAARKPGGVFDRIVSVSSLTSASTPDFWVAITGILVFAVTLRVLPTSGYGMDIKYWVLPVAVLMMRPFGLLVQVVRASMINTLSSAYVRTARVKGMREGRILYVHGLRNALLSIITVAGDQAVGMFNGLVIIESIFGFPGIGKLMIDAVLARDFPVVQASILITALAIFILFLVIDLAYVALDPRIRNP